LAAFALSALLDSAASVVLVRRFKKEQSDAAAAERLERWAQKWIAIAMLLVATYICIQAIRGLVDQAHPEGSTFGVVLAVVSLLFLPGLGYLKIRLGSRLASIALRGDGVLTLAAAVLAAITLAALILDSRFGWWWADATAGAFISVALAAEATRITLRHRFG
jgi:divalent metal cation (Fe/Co/Zn/Cd) transporter